MNIPWRPPWQPFESPEEKRSVEAELRREMPSTHILAKLDFEALGRHERTDDHLFLIRETNKLAFVHLTYRQETDPTWPYTIVYNSLDEWLDDILIPQHEEWLDVQEKRKR